MAFYIRNIVWKFTKKNTTHMRYSLNSLKGVIFGSIIGITRGGYQEFGLRGILGVWTQGGILGV